MQKCLTEHFLARPLNCPETIVVLREWELKKELPVDFSFNTYVCVCFHLWQCVKNPLQCGTPGFNPLGWENPLETRMDTLPVFLPGGIPSPEGLVGLYSIFHLPNTSWILYFIFFLLKCYWFILILSAITATMYVYFGQDVEQEGKG